MDQSTLLYVMAAAVIVSAVALVIQMFLLMQVYKATMTMSERVLNVMPKVESLVDSARGVVEESRVAVSEIRTKSNLILDSGYKQMQQVEALLADVSERANRQFSYAEAVVQDTLERVESTVELVHRGVLKPLKGITGIAAGVTAAIQFLLRRRPNPHGATLDEEMFI